MVTAVMAMITAEGSVFALSAVLRMLALLRMLAPIVGIGCIRL